MSFIDNQEEFDLLVARVKEQLEARENEYGYRHSLGCAQCCAQMALVYGIDEPRAYLAGLLHDWDRCVPKPELIEEARAMGFDITPEVLAAPAILHAHTGAAAVAAQFPEVAAKTPEIITAIERHTVGVPDMAPLDMLLYIADMIEPTRLSPNIADLREMVGTVDLDTLFMQAYQRSMAHLVRRRKVMHPDTIRVWNALVMRGEIGQDVVFPDPATITPALADMDPGEIPPELRGTWRNISLTDTATPLLDNNSAPITPPAPGNNSAPITPPIPGNNSGPITPPVPGNNSGLDVGRDAPGAPLK